MQSQITYSVVLLLKQSVTSFQNCIEHCNSNFVIRTVKLNES